jgi:hypothetical protein
MDWEIVLLIVLGALAVLCSIGFTLGAYFAMKERQKP